MTAEERPTMIQRRALAAAITALIRPSDAGEDDERGATAKRDTSILVVYGHGRGDFQTLSFRQACDYRRCLEDGGEGAPWQLGIR